METVRLGRTGLNVGVAALGTGGKSRLGQSRGATFEHSVGVVQAALDAGVTLVDTAQIYGTEEIVGAAIRGRRDRVVVSTKVPVAKDGVFGPGAVAIDGPALMRLAEGCLRRLGTDYVDIFHLHAVAPELYRHCREELVPALESLRQAGKIRFTGLTERFSSDTRHAMLAAALADDVWDVMMVGFNYVNQTALRRILPEARRRDIATLCMFAVRGPLARAEAARALVERLIALGEVDPALVDRADPLAFLLAGGAARSLTDAAYRFCRHAPGIDVVLTGTGSVDHLRENLASIGSGRLPDAVLARLAAIFGRVESEAAER